MFFMAMDRNRDSRRANVSSMNGLRKRQRVTVQKDQKDEGVLWELQETVKLGDPERLKKEKERGFTKRRIDRFTAQQRSGGDGSGNESADLSDEEYCEDEDDARVHHPRNRFPSPSSLSVVKNRRGFRNLAAFQDPRNCADEILGFHVPRRARSATARKFPGTLASRNMCGASTAPFDASSKTKTALWNGGTSDFLATPADIEIEAAEALFDLMQQSYSKTQARAEPETLDRDKICDAHDGLKILRGDVNDKNNSFTDEDEASAKTKAGESVHEVEPTSKCEVGSPKESETLSNVKANARDIRDPTATNANHAADSKARKLIKFEIDLMAPPPLPSSPERDVLVDVDQQAVAKVENRGFSQQLAHTNSKNQLTSSLLPLAGETNKLHGVLPPGGYMTQRPAIYPTDASARYVKPPQFKISQPQSKRCALHHCIASNIQKHKKLAKSLSSSAAGPADICGSQMLNLNALLTPQNHIPGDSNVLKKSVSISDASSSLNGSLNNQSLHQQVLYQCGPGSIYPMGHLQPMKTTGSSAVDQTAGATGNASLLSNPAERSTMNFSHPVFPPSEVASLLMSSLLNDACPVPISSSTTLPSFKGVPSTVPLLEPSFFPPSCFSFNQNQLLSIPRSPKLPASQNTSSLPENQLLSLQPKKADRQLEASSSSNGQGRSSSTPKLGSLAPLPTNPYSTQTGLVFGQLMKTNGYASPSLKFPSVAPSCGTFQLPPDVLRTTTTTTTRSCSTEHQKHKASNPSSIAAASFLPGKWETSTIPTLYAQQQLKNSVGQPTLLTFSNSPAGIIKAAKGGSL